MSNNRSRKCDWGVPREREAVISALEPVMASFSLGSMNYGLHPMAEHLDLDYEWERDYLESTRSFVYNNSFEFLETILPIFDEHGTTPELECYDVGHLNIAKYLVDQEFSISLSTSSS